MKIMQCFFLVFMVTSRLLAEEYVLNWSSTIGFPDGHTADALISTQTGEYVVAGRVGNPEAALMVKLNSVGDTLWTRTYNDTLNSAGWDLIETSDGNYLMTGFGATSESGDYDVLLVKVNQEGDVIWRKYHDRGQFDWGLSLVETGGGYMIAAYSSAEPAGLWVLRLDAQGDTVWTRNYTDLEYGWSILETADGNFLVAGRTASNTGRVLKLDSFGDIVWYHDYEFYDIQSISAFEPNSYLICGGKNIGEHEYTGSLTAIDHNGDSLWTHNTATDSLVWLRASVRLSQNRTAFVGSSNARGLRVGFRDATQDVDPMVLTSPNYISATDIVLLNDQSYTSLGYSNTEMILVNWRAVAFQSLTGSPGDGQMLLSWSEIPPEYDLTYIYRKSEENEFTLIDSVQTNGDGSYLDQNLTNGTLYSYYVDIVDYGQSNVISEYSNAAPQFEPIAAQTTLEDVEITIPFSINDPDGDEVSISVENTQGVVSSYLLNENSISLQFEANWNGTTELMLVASDYSMSDTVTVTILVNPINDPPQIAPIGNQTTPEEVPITVSLTFSDVDSDSLALSASSDTNAVIIEVSDQSLQLTPATDWVGTSQVTAIIDDGEYSMFESFVLSVTNVNDAPILTPLDDQFMLEDSLLVINTDAIDIDSDNLIFSCIDIDGEFSSSVDENSITIWPDLNWYGATDVGIIVSDSQLSDTTFFHLSVTNVNDPPQANTRVITAEEGVATYTILSGTPGPWNEEEQAMSYIINALPIHGFISDEEGEPYITQDQLPFHLIDDDLFYTQHERYVTDALQFYIEDDGGTDNGGIDTSEFASIRFELNVPYLFTIPTFGPIKSGITLLDSNSIYAAASSDYVYRFDKQGSQQYTLDVNGEVRSSTTITQDHVVYIASTDNNLYSFNANGVSNSGWPLSLGAQSTASTAIDALGNVYIGTSNGIYQAVNSYGDVIWAYNVSGAVYASSAIGVDNTLYVINENGRILAFDLNSIDPDLVQPRTIYEIGENVYSSPALDPDGNIYVTSVGGSLYKLNDSGASISEVWQYNTESSIESSPIISSTGLILFGSNDGVIYCVDGEGNEVWANPTGDAVTSTGALAEYDSPQDRVYFGSRDGHLYAVSLLDGTTIWKFNTQSEIECPILYSDAVVYFGTMDGEIIAIEDSEVVVVASTRNQEESIWGTFQGNNLRTGYRGTQVAVDEHELPEGYSIQQNYPNPFNPSTTIRYSLPEASTVNMIVYDMSGHLVNHLVRASQAAGWYEVQWNGTASDGTQVSTGVYFARIAAGSFNAVIKMVYLR